MDEYIKKEDALKALTLVDCDNARAKMAVADVPAADVVEVIRCEDCNHYEVLMDVSTSGMCCLPGEFQRKMPKDGFCSYGERR